jgi:CheY-like chemotaxis protein
MSQAAKANGKILVVEDDPEIREVVRDVLQDEGYAVVTATNGKEGLERLRQMARPCLVLLDLLMPVMNGGEFLTALRTTDVLATLPVVVFSAWSEEAQKIRDDTQGFVEKPVSLPALLDTVTKFCAPGADHERR